jgi:hypothetical protein
MKIQPIRSKARAGPNHGSTGFPEDWQLKYLGKKSEEDGGSYEDDALLVDDIQLLGDGCRCLEWR